MPWKLAECFTPYRRQAALIGRQTQMAQLQQACQNLLDGHGAVNFITGSLGKGKTRLIKEFQATVDVTTVPWYEGHAYANTAHVPSALFAENHFLTAIRLAQETGARGFLGQPCLQLGVLYKAQGKIEQARGSLLEAQQTFAACEMNIYAQRAAELLE